MRVAFVVPSLANKGPIIVVKDLCDFLSQEGHKCVVFYFDNIIELKFDCEVKKISFWQPSDFKEFDIIHTHMLRPDAYGFMHSFWNGNHNKLITTIHNYFIEDLTFSYGKFIAKLTSPFWKLFWSRYKKNVVLSKSACKYYKNLNIRSEKLEVVYNGRDISQIDIETSDLKIFEELNERGLVVLGTVAVFNERKGLEQIINLLEKDKQYAFVIVGDGTERENLLKLAENKKVADRFFILGSRSRGFRYNKYFDVYVIPSRSEGVPLSMVEAVAMKTPVVCSNIEIFNELFDNSEVAFFELDDIESLNSAIKKLRQDRNQKIKAAYDKYLIRYTRKVMSEAYLSVYMKMK